MTELNIINEKTNELFSRKEIEAEINSDSTPKKEEITELIAKKFSVLGESIKIDGIHGNFGSSLFSITAKIYNSVEEKNSTEKKQKEKK